MQQPMQGSHTIVACPSRETLLAFPPPKSFELTLQGIGENKGTQRVRVENPVFILTKMLCKFEGVCLNPEAGGRITIAGWFSIRDNTGTVSYG